MSQAPSPYKPSLFMLLFILGYGLHQFAWSFGPSQEVIDLLERMSLASIAAGVPLAWMAGRRVLAGFYLAWTVFHVVMGPPEPSVNTQADFIAGVVLMGIMAFALVGMLVGFIRQRQAKAVTPTPTA
jgi:hypothetical protein